MIVLLVSGIVGLVLLTLGAVFTVLGVVLSDAGDFLYVGVPLLVVGAVLAAVFAVRRQDLAKQRERRRAGTHTRALVVRAELKPWIRMGVMLAYDLTVQFVPAGEVTRRVFVVPGTQLAEGAYVEVAYDPAEPANFELTS